MTRFSWTLTLLLLIPGCSTNLLAPSGAPPKLYTLTAPAQIAGAGSAVNWQLLVAPPNATLDLDSSRIAVAPSSDRIDYYADVAWVDRAPALIQSMIVESFDRSGRIAAVQRQGGGLRSDFELASVLHDFEVDTDAATPSAHVQITAKLVRTRDRSIVAGRTFDSTAPVTSDKFDAVVAAFNGALADILPEIVTWTLDAGRNGP